MTSFPSPVGKVILAAPTSSHAVAQRAHRWTRGSGKRSPIPPREDEMLKRRWGLLRWGTSGCPHRRAVAHLPWLPQKEHPGPLFSQVPEEFFCTHVHASQNSCALVSGAIDGGTRGPTSLVRYFSFEIHKIKGNSWLNKRHPHPPSPYPLALSLYLWSETCGVRNKVSQRPPECWKGC